MLYSEIKINLFSRPMDDDESDQLYEEVNDLVERIKTCIEANKPDAITRAVVIHDDFEVG